LNEIVVIGAGGHARVVADVIRLMGELTIHGFIDQAANRRGEPFVGARIIGGDQELDDVLRSGVAHAAVAVGDNEARMRIGEELVQKGFRLPVLIHPSATVAADVAIGDGTLICAGAIINPATSVGRFAIINTAASLDHDCSIRDGVHVAPGARLGGHVTVGEGTLIGLGASVKPAVRIGARVTVGVGAAVLQDVRDGATVIGVPAREMT
jgi:sugar O-acyltransferase (sialic acid O-acetyltransferase NeuD family)